MKKELVFVIIGIVLIAIVSAQDLGGIGDSIEDKIGEVEGNLTKAREFTEQNKTDFLAESWKKLVLKNKFISGTNWFFEKIDIVFVLLFAKHWEFSITMLFVFMLWLFTLLSIREYNLFSDNEGLSWLIGLGGAILIAHMKLFNLVANALFGIFAYKNNLPWKISSFVLIFVLFVVYLKLNKFVGKILKKRREKNKEKKKEHKEKVRDTYDKNLKDAAESVEGA